MVKKLSLLLWLTMASLGVKTLLGAEKNTLPVTSQIHQDSVSSQGAIHPELHVIAESSATSVSSVFMPKTRADTVIIIQHQFDHKEQIITGSVIMSCMILVLALMNNYNPR